MERVPQSGQAAAGPVAVALQAWLDASDLTEGALFRRVWVSRVRPALSDRVIALIIQRRAGGPERGLRWGAGIACAQGSSPRGPGKGAPCPP